MFKLVRYFLLIISVILSALSYAGVTLTDISLESRKAHARVYFNKKLFNNVLVFLGPSPEALDARMMVAESLFRVRRYAEARKAFLELLPLEKDTEEQCKILIRIFDAALLGKRLVEAIASYDDYEKKFANAPDIMSYALGQALFGVGKYEEAKKLLLRIREKEFGMRARYLLAVMGLDSVSNAQSIKHFALISQIKPISVEDYSVRELAILAQARLYFDDKKYLDAQAAYEKIPPNSKFAEAATSELIRTILANTGKQSLASALSVIYKYRKKNNINLLKPELWTLEANLLARQGRLNEANIKYTELIEHYQNIKKKLLKNKEQNNIQELISGVPQRYLKDLPGLERLNLLKQRIEEIESELLDLEENSALLDISIEAIKAARQNQKTLKANYEKLALSLQPELAKLSANIINNIISEAEFMRALLPIKELGNIKKQEDALRQFQSNIIEKIGSSL